MITRDENVQVALMESAEVLIAKRSSAADRSLSDYFRHYTILGTLGTGLELVDHV